jgi:hypothetical protein
MGGGFGFPPLVINEYRNQMDPNPQHCMYCILYNNIPQQIIIAYISCTFYTSHTHLTVLSLYKTVTVIHCLHSGLVDVPVLSNHNVFAREKYNFPEKIFRNIKKVSKKWDFYSLQGTHRFCTTVYTKNTRVSDPDPHGSALI